VRGRPFRTESARCAGARTGAAAAETVGARAQSVRRGRNAIITILIILMIGAGGAYVYGRKMLEAPGPLMEDKVVNIPARSKTRENRRDAAARGRDRYQSWLFMARRLR